MGRTPERGVRPFFTSKSLRDFDGGLSRCASTALNPWNRCSAGWARPTKEVRLEQPPEGFDDGPSRSSNGPPRTRRRFFEAPPEGQRWSIRGPRESVVETRGELRALHPLPSEGVSPRAGNPWVSTLWRQNDCHLRRNPGGISTWVSTLWGELDCRLRRNPYGISTSLRDFDVLPQQIQKLLNRRLPRVLQHRQHLGIELLTRGAPRAL